MTACLLKLAVPELVALAQPEDLDISDFDAEPLLPGL